MKLRALIIAIVMLTAFAASANPDVFKKGPVFDFGPVAAIEADMVIPKRAKFKVAFDTAKASEEGKINRTFETAARFINMHVTAGVPQKNLDVAIIVHGKASFNLVSQANNANVSAIKALTDEGVRIILCGQSAAYHGVNKDDLAPNVEMALSAMTAHALLQQDGYTLNPF